MILVPPSLAAILRGNRAAGLAAAESEDSDHDPVPVLKLFNPCGAATWLVTELYDDGDTLFGLADLGFGCPELGVFSLVEIMLVRLPFGLGIERDLGFATRHPLSVWSTTAHRLGSITAAEAALSGPAPELPSPRRGG